MRIGILTYHAVYNFGANLQVYSTVGYLQKNGFEPVVINWIPKDLEERYDKSILTPQAEMHKKFIKKNFSCTKICRTEQDIVNAINTQKINAILVGSDAVLQHKPFLSRISLSKKGIKYTKPSSDIVYPNPFWCSFLSFMKKKIPVFMMSASSQNTYFRFIVGSLKKKMNSSLQKFSSITVRDEWTRDMIRYLTNGSIIPDKTPDPVFAYNQNIIKQITKEEIYKKFNLPDKYLLLSFRCSKCITNDWLEKLNTLSRDYGIECFMLPMPNGIRYNPQRIRKINLPISPDEWYALIKYSSGYVGENMHPIVVAIHNKVPFYSFDSYGIIKFKYFVNYRSSKIFDILSDAGLLQNWTNTLGRGYEAPKPSYVIDRLIGFDVVKCGKFASKQIQSYSNMMANIAQKVSQLV